TLVPDRRDVEAVKEMLARPEQPRRDRDVHLVDEPRLEILTDRRYATADLHVLPPSCLSRSLERAATTIRDEVEDRSAFHLDRGLAVVRHHDYRAVVWRIPAPPAAPGVIGPGSANRTEHVAAHDPRADALAKSCSDIVVDARRATVRVAVDALERAGRDEPVV